MATCAFFNLPARGHLNPTVPVVKELVRRGTHVHYFMNEEYRKPIELAGGTFHPLPALNRLGGASTQRGLAPDDKQVALMPFAMAYQAPQVIPQLVEALRALAPDCLVYNTLSLWPRLAARILDIPTVGFRPFHGPRTHRPVVAPFASERLARLAAATDRELSALMASYTKPPLSLADLVSQVDDLTLMFVPREFQHDAEAFDERFLFVGPSFIDGEPESWPFKDRPDKRLRHAYVSLGTMRNDDPEFYRACFSAFAPDEWQVVMSVGEQVDLDSLAPVPENFLVVRSVHQTALLPHADVFVTHGGLNSVMESLAFCVPMVVVPSIKEQQLTARRVQALGCGLELDRDAVTAASLLRHASVIVDHEAIKSRLSIMREKIAAAGGYKRAASAILEHVRKAGGNQDRGKQGKSSPDGNDPNATRWSNAKEIRFT
jgi:MGT family glycosyltransferase